MNMSHLHIVLFLVLGLVILPSVSLALSNEPGAGDTPQDYPITPCSKEGGPGTPVSQPGTPGGNTGDGTGPDKPVSSSCISLDKNTYVHGENMTVTWIGSPGYADNAWIGIIPSKAGHTEPDSDAVNLPEPYWQYIGRKTGGTSTYPAPDTTGTYDFRMFDGDDGSTAKEVCSVTFTVVNNSPVSGCITLDKTTYVHGEKMQVTWVGSPLYYDDAWIGIIPADAPHTEPGSDAVNLPEPYWEYIKKKTAGRSDYTAPDTTGRYEFRMFDGDGNGNSQEICAAPFTVVNNSPIPGCIILDKSSYLTGEKMQVTWVGSPLYYDDAWIGIIPADAPHTEPGADAVNLPEPYWQYIGRKTGGESSFTAPATPGSYEFRMFDGDGNSNSQEICSASFTVVKAG